MSILNTIAAAIVAITLLVPCAWAQDDEDTTFEVNGYLKVQSGIFAPLLSDLFQSDENIAWIRDTDGNLALDNDGNSIPCDPVMTPHKPCYPESHGQKAGGLSMMRAVLQLEADWKPHEKVGLHAIVRGVRSLETDADGWAQPPVASNIIDPEERRAAIRDWVRDKYYTQFELREFYLDIYPTDWFSLRLGRQQITWGETGQFRLLDVINPIDTTWHFGPLESFEDTRIPLWLAKGLFEFPEIDHALELVWMPGLDRPEDMVTVPLTFVGAWGLPYTNTPSPFIINEKVFKYPKRAVWDTMRAGFRWKGNITPSMSYSLVYYYTHQLSPPIPLYYDKVKLGPDLYDSKNLERLYLGFPRQHIMGFTFDFTLENPIGAVVKIEAALEPNRMYPRTSTTGQTHPDPIIPSRVHFEQPRRMALSYAVVVMRPTMIRFLNPTQNFMFVFQFMHTVVPGLTETDKIDLIEIPGFNDFKVKMHSMKFVFAAFTNYLHGLLTPKLIVVWIPPDPDRVNRSETDPSKMSSSDFFTKSSMFIAASLAVRLGDHWRLKLTVSDFFGFGGPYAGAGLFGDRDEINLSVLCQF
ncbi:MAG: hypothetical protein JRJ87_05650 [Deltaproteobacteria bacterium]|nr:hypothetical protein [Deltaproteobacteria bacterium]